MKKLFQDCEIYRQRQKIMTPKEVSQMILTVYFQKERERKRKKKTRGLKPMLLLSKTSLQAI